MESLDDDDEDEEDEDEEEEEEEEETRNVGFCWILRSFFWTLGLTSDAWTLPPNLVFNIFVFGYFWIGCLMKRCPNSAASPSPADQ